MSCHASDHSGSDPCCKKCDKSMGAWCVKLLWESSWILNIPPPWHLQPFGCSLNFAVRRIVRSRSKLVNATWSLQSKHPPNSQEVWQGGAAPLFGIIIFHPLYPFHPHHFSPSTGKTLRWINEHEMNKMNMKVTATKVGTRKWHVSCILAVENGRWKVCAIDIGFNWYEMEWRWWMICLAAENRATNPIPRPAVTVRWGLRSPT